MFRENGNVEVSFKVEGRNTLTLEFFFNLRGVVQRVIK